MLLSVFVPLVQAEPIKISAGSMNAEIKQSHLFEEKQVKELFAPVSNTVIKTHANFEIPKFTSIVSDCAKMKELDKLLKKLKAGGHRCLIFCQMTKMLDILEDYMIWKGYTYYRMDGSTQLSDRHEMVEQF